MARMVIPTTINASPEEASWELERSPFGGLPAETLDHFRTGLEYLNHGGAEEAVACFAQALQNIPDYADAHVGLGIAYAMTSRIYAALDHLQRAVELEPCSFYAHFKLGQLYFKLRIPQKGYEETAQALHCATSLEERRLVAQLLHEERQHEKSGIARPWWNKPFPWALLFGGTGMIAALMLMLFVHLR